MHEHPHHSYNLYLQKGNHQPYPKVLYSNCHPILDKHLHTQSRYHALHLNYFHQDKHRISRSHPHHVRVLDRTGKHGTHIDPLHNEVRSNSERTNPHRHCKLNVPHRLNLCSHRRQDHQSL